MLDEPVPFEEEVDRPVGESTRLIAYRPGRAADAARAIMAAKAEEDTQQTEPAVASWAADLAARVANLVSRSTHSEAPRKPEIARPSRSGKPRESEPTRALWEQEPAPGLWETQSRHSSQEAASRRDSWQPRHADRRSSWHSDETRLTRGNELPNTEAAEIQIAEADTFEVPPTNVADHAQALRRTAARMAANSARGRIGASRTDHETGISVRGNRTG